jgi:hypothetical protein
MARAGAKHPALRSAFSVGIRCLLSRTGQIERQSRRGRLHADHSVLLIDDKIA